MENRNGEILSFLIPFVDLGIAILAFRVLLSPRQVPALLYFQNQLVTLLIKTG